MAKPGLRKVHRYSTEFKITAVKLSDLPDVLIQDVADALDIHPFMLSRWRKQFREGTLVGTKKKIVVDPKMAAELKRLRKVERQYAILQEEHEILKKAIRFSSERKRKSSSSSRNNGDDSQ